MTCDVCRVTCDVWLLYSATNPSFGLAAAAAANCDASDFSSVLARCTSVPPQLTHLRLLISVAGVMTPPQRSVSVVRITRLMRRRCNGRLWRIQRRRRGEGLKIRHTSHVTRHTSHVTRHTSHVTRHTCCSVSDVLIRSSEQFQAHLVERVSSSSSSGGGGGGGGPKTQWF